MTRPRTLALALVVAAGCDCAGKGSTALWVGALDGARVEAVDQAGGLTTAASPPAIDTPVRALLALGDGSVLALQEPEVCDGGTFDPGGACTPAGATVRSVPPGVLLARDGTRVASLAADDGPGGSFFSHASPPWAAAQDGAGRIWVTGGKSPVVYGGNGAVTLVAEALAFETRGVTARSDGTVVVSYGVAGLAVYAADGAVAARLAPSLPPEYGGIDALLARPDGSLLLATRRYGVTSAGVVLAARLDGGAFSLAMDPSLSATLAGGVPSALALGRGAIVAAPPLGRLADPQCGRWLSDDLTLDLGCLAPVVHRGAAWLP